MNWLLSIAVKKVISRVVGVLIAYIAALNLQRFGITIDTNQLTLALFAGIEFLRNYLKVKFNLKFL